MSGPIEGRAWVFAEANINTDLMMPPRGYALPPAERALLVFSANRPGWAAQVREGDILVCGRNFGTGSSRPAPEMFRELGIRAIVAESFNGLFFRNCINYALPAVECPGILAAVQEGDIVSIDAAQGVVSNPARAAALTGTRIPPALMDIIAAGGLLAQMQALGHF